MSILAEVKNFCNQKNITGALLISGQWGCGKSYFIQHELCKDDDIKRNFATVKISLFGITTPEQFTLALKKEYIKIRYASFLSKDGEKKFSAAIKTLKKAITVFVPTSDFIFSADWSMFVSIENFNNREILLIFDDYERCELETSIIFGLLNEYIEALQFKTIIIANEETLNIGSQNERYTMMKEKIISRTIKLIPDHIAVSTNIINTYIETECGYKQFLLDNLDDVARAFLDSKTSNIRSLKCALQDFERFYHSINSYIDDKVTQSYMFYDFLAMVFEYKVGNLQGAHSDGTVNLGDGLFEDNKMKEKYKQYNKLYKIKAMEKWVVNGEWDEQLLNDELQQICKLLKGDEPKEILLRYQDLMFVDDDIFEKGFSPLLEDAYNGVLDLNSYVDIFEMIISANYYNISLPCLIDDFKLKSGIEKRMSDLEKGKAVESFNYQRSISTENMQYLSPEHIEIVESIKRFRKDIIYISQRPQIINALRNRDLKTVREVFERYTGAFDKDYAKIVVEYYFSLNNNEKRYFIYALKSSWEHPSIYSESNIDKSIEGIIFLQELIKPTAKEGKIVTALNKILYGEAAKMTAFYENKKIEYKKMDTLAAE